MQYLIGLGSPGVSGTGLPLAAGGDDGRIRVKRAAAKRLARIDGQVSHELRCAGLSSIMLSVPLKRLPMYC